MREAAARPPGAGLRARSLLVCYRPAGAKSLCGSGHPRGASSSVLRVCGQSGKLLREPHTQHQRQLDPRPSVLSSLSKASWAFVLPEQPWGL